MNSDLMPSPESFNSSVSNQAATNMDVAVSHTLAVQSSELENSAVNSTKTPDNNENLATRQQPIPPPSEPMQYRAIGLVRGRYLASSEQFTQGTLLTNDDAELNAVLLGRIMSLVKNHLDLEKEHLWVVYPRTRQENDALHLQIVGVWEPEKLTKHFPEKNDLEDDSPELDVSDHGLPETPKAEASESIKSSTEIPDGGFSVRGEVVYQSFDAKSLVVKIKQAPRKPTDKPKYFKLKLKGVLTTKAVGKFWDFNVKRETDALIVENAEAIADLPKKRKPPFKGGPRSGARKPFPSRRNGETPHPVRKVGGESSVVSRPVPKPPAPKPVKRTKPPQE